jgi:riboflavin kinase
LKKQLGYKGKVIRGNKEGKQFVSLPWVRKQMNMKLGFDPYLGTLNLLLLDEANNYELRNAKGIKIESKIGYYEGKCFEAIIMEEIKAVVVLPLIPDYPVNLLELISPVNLRKTLRINDGDIIQITVNLQNAE